MSKATNMPSHFDKLGIEFQYPDNWLLEEEPIDDGETVSVVSPAGAFWWLAVFPPDRDLSEVVRAVLDGLRLEHTGADIEPIVELVNGQEMIGYDIDFVCLDLTNTAQIRGFQTEQASYVLLWQSEDRDFPAVEPVFRAITKSLVETAE